MQCYGLKSVSDLALTKPILTFVRSRSTRSPVDWARLCRLEEAQTRDPVIKQFLAEVALEFELLAIEETRELDAKS
jgi:hypothetical protein